MLDIGRVVDRYTIEALVGQGGMAEVYRVRHTTLGVAYALKVLTVSGKELRARLVAEGRAQSQLQHPNILRVIDVIDVDGQPGLILDYVDGPDLGDWIAANKPDLKTAEAMFRGIVAAVQTAHHAGLVHRDLKPANVLVATGPNGEPVPKVADFGLAKAIAGDTSLKATRSGVPMGTPAYMPPEQIRDAATVDARADIFALGCILFELLAHNPAFVGPDAVTIFNQVLDGKREALPPGLPARITKTVEGCVEVDRDERLQSCAHVLNSLDGRTAKKARHPRITAQAMVAAAVAVLTVSGAGALGAGWLAYWLQSGVEEMFAPPCTPESTGWVMVNGGGLPREKRAWEARAETNVHETAAGAVVCTLPTGSSATIAEAREDEWVSIHELHPAQPNASVPDSPPICYGIVEGWANTRTVFNKPKSGREIWTPSSTQMLFVDRPTKENEWETKHEAVCQLASGSKATISGPQEKVSGTGWWLPISEVR